jgi:hypothetical protein
MVDTVTINEDQTGPSLEEEAAAQEAEAAKAQEDSSELPSDEGSGEGNGEGNGEEKVKAPEGVPEKFLNEDGTVNVEALAKSYTELEKMKGQSQEDAEGQQEAAEKAVSDAGLDMEALSAEYTEKGELAPESYEALEKAGIPKAMVDQYIAGLEAQQAATREALLAPAGGEEGYNEMITWAADNLSEAEIDRFNAALESGDQNTMQLAVENLASKYTAETGSEPSRDLAGKPSAGQSAYQSTAELMKDMQDKRYAEDPAFRAKVEQKLARSSIL